MSRNGGQDLEFGMINARSSADNQPWSSIGYWCQADLWGGIRPNLLERR